MMQNVIGFSRALSVKAVLAGRKSSTIYVATALFFLLQLVLPLVVDEWTLRIILFANIFVIYAASYDLLAGYTGLVSFGHSLFFGGAGYVSGLLSLNLGLPLLACVIAALIAALVTALGVGYISLRLKGPYLAVVTLVFPLVLANIVHLSPRYLGGDDGIAGFDLLGEGSLQTQFYIALFVTLAATLVILRLARGDFGLILKTVREDELGAEAIGINTTKYKVLAFVISGGFAALAGTLYTHIMGSVGPTTISLNYSILPVIMMALGGASSIVGAMLGAYVITLLDLYLQALPYVRVLIYAAIIIAVLRFFPSGLIGLLKRIWR
jgi:branched-chain amino acid transport system permease protein